jgi:Ni/Co efflux regulator RcnB
MKRIIISITAILILALPLSFAQDNNQTKTKQQTDKTTQTKDQQKKQRPDAE